MPKSSQGDSPFADYATVAERITLFYERYPTGRILTRLHSRTEREITFRALVFRDAADTRPAATGWASEREGDGEINEVACLENTETSAIGRALANLGFTASSRRPSREEMEKAGRTRARQKTLLRYPPQRPLSAPAVGEPAARRASMDLQAHADAVTDLLALLRSAQHCGLRPRRADWIDMRIRHSCASPAMLDRLGRRLRRWIASSVDRRMSGWSAADDL
jgi:hypothetical protein